jgi:hypothetical protein
MEMVYLHKQMLLKLGFYISDVALHFPFPFLIVTLTYHTFQAEVVD